MNNFIASLLLVFLLAAAAPAHSQPLLSQPLDRMVAVVDESVILQSELDRSVAGILQQYAGNAQQLPPRDVLARQVLDRIILMKLQSQRAAETGIRISDGEIDSTIAGMAQQSGMTLDQLRQTVQRDGVSYSEFRESMREEMLIQRLQQRFVQSRVSVSETEIDNLLARNNEERVEVHLSHILISVPDGADAETIRLGQEKADGVLDLIRDDRMDFAAAAIRYSNAPNALEGGDLGWRDVNEVPPMFVDLVKSMRTGDVSPATRGPAGFHILKLHERRVGAPRIVQQYHTRHLLIAVDELTDNTKARAEIDRLHERLLAGEDFVELARQHSKDHNTAPLGGDMGWFAIDGYGSVVASVLSQLQPGQISQPFLSDLGWHVLQLLETREEDMTATFQRQQAAELLRNRKAEEEYDRYLRQLRAEAYIENRLALDGP